LKDFLKEFNYAAINIQRSFVHRYPSFPIRTALIHNYNTVI